MERAPPVIAVYVIASLASLLEQQDFDIPWIAVCAAC
jgi:hypothetical protein